MRTGAGVSCQRPEARRAPRTQCPVQTPTTGRRRVGSSVSRGRFLSPRALWLLRQRHARQPLDAHTVGQCSTPAARPSLSSDTSARRGNAAFPKFQSRSNENPASSLHRPFFAGFSTVFARTAARRHRREEAPLWRRLTAHIAGIAKQRAKKSGKKGATETFLDFFLFRPFPTLSLSLFWCVFSGDAPPRPPYPCPWAWRARRG